MKSSLPLLLALAACDTPTGDTAEDTAGAVDSGDTATCDVHVIGVNPTDGAMAVYYRDPVYVSFDGDGSAAVVEVRDAAGGAAALTPTWDDAHTLLTLSGVLAASTEYTVHAELCGVVTEAHFTTSALGSPLTITPEELTNRTFSFALRDAEITEPEALEILGDASLVTPLGFMVQQADSAQLELLGAVLGYVDDGLVQVEETATWDFPTADFSEQPYFHVAIDELPIVYDSSLGPVLIRLYDFDMEGLFAPDGSAIEHGTVVTLVDSRGLGPLLSLPDTSDDAVCTYAAPFGVECIPCPDGEPYCIHTVGEDITAPLVPGLTLTPWPVE